MTRILKNWDFMRFLRLGIGLWLAYAAINEHQLIIGVMAGLFIIQAMMNLGCGSKGCMYLTIIQIRKLKILVLKK